MKKASTDLQQLMFGAESDGIGAGPSTMPRGAQIQKPLEHFAACLLLE